MRPRTTKICLVLAVCVLTLTGCIQRTQERAYRPDPRDGHINELLRGTENLSMELGSVVVSTHAVLEQQPFQQEELTQLQIPTSSIGPDDLTDCIFAEGRLACCNLPANHIVRQSDLLAQGFNDGWRPVHRAKKVIVAGELFTEENTIRRFVRISEDNATQDILMHTATRPISPGEIIHRSDTGPDLWENVYYAVEPIRKGEIIDCARMKLRVVKASDLDEEWNYADCNDMTEVFYAARDITCGAPIRCSDIK